MRIRNVALLPAVVCAVSIVASVISVYTVTHGSLRGPVGSLLVSLVMSLLPGLLAQLAFALFFLIVFAESLGLLKPQVRVVAAIVSSALAALYAAVSVIQVLIFAVTMLSGSKFIDSATKYLTIRSLGFVEIVVSILFLAAFALEKNNVGSRLIPKVAVVLAVVTLVRALSNIVLFYSPSTLKSMYSLLGVFNGAVLVVFFVAVWQCWRSGLSIHENVALP